MPRLFAISSLFIFYFFAPVIAADDLADNSPKPQAVQDVLDGKRTAANAAWWGFDRDDATDSLQAALNSGAKKLIIPNMGRDWIVRPLFLQGNMEVVLEKGVVIAAKRGEYRGGGDTVFSANNLENLTIRGYGATIRMHKEDYIVGLVLKDLGWNRWYGQYDKAEWRMALAIRGGRNVKVFGLRLQDSGGDGIYVDRGRNIGYSQNVYLKDIVCDNHYRQGISVISVDGLVVENCKFNNTWGTPPSAGVDIEPDSPDQIIKNVTFRNCEFADNYGDGIELFLSHMTEESGDISILFDRCRVTSRRGPGIRISKIADEGPAGLIEFRDCVVENTVGYGIKVQDKSAAKARIKFVRCQLKHVAQDKGYRAAWVPIWLHLYRPNRTKRLGGIDFIDCQVVDDRDRAAIFFSRSGEEGVFTDVHGRITVKNPHGVRAETDNSDASVDLVVK